MRNVLQSITVLFALSSCLSAQTTTAVAPPPAPAAAPAPAGPTADDVARRAVDMLAGPAWEKARYFAFTFNALSSGVAFSSYSERWDRTTGDYRVSGRDPRGIPFLIIMNVNTKKGRVWRDNQEVENPADFLDIGYRRFVNDTFWLLMPIKSMDPGAHRELIGERTDSCGVQWDVVKLTFDSGALGAQDQYWMWVNRDTGLVDEWDMRLTGTRPEDPAQRVYFHDYRRVGGLLLSTRREIRDRNQEFRIDDLVVSPEVPAGAFRK